MKDKLKSNNLTNMRMQHTRSNNSQTNNYEGLYFTTDQENQQIITILVEDYRT